jgi:hypothetical protein
MLVLFDNGTPRTLARYLMIITPSPKPALVAGSSDRNQQARHRTLEQVFVRIPHAPP